MMRLSEKPDFSEDRMQYFSVISRQDGKRPRTCFMLQDSTMDAAMEKARTLVLSDHLPHVDRRAEFSIRRASRRETSLLQSYLASGTHDRMTTYLQEDLDSLLARRKTMLLSFFIALYLDPDALRARFDPSAPGETAADAPGSSGGGSGGIEIQTDQQASQTETMITPPVENDGGIDLDQDASDDNLDQAPVGDDSQINALDDILNTPVDTGDRSDDEMSLF